MIVTTLTIAILGGNIGALLWLFADETGRSRLAVIGLVGAALCIRLMYPNDYPPGFNPDEPQHCVSAKYPRATDEPTNPTADHLPSLSPALFCVPLLPYVDQRLAIRGYSIALGSLSTAVIFALCRSMSLGVPASLTSAALLAVLPWSLFYGRTSIGGDVVYYALLFGTALARMIWRPRAGWREALLAVFALALSLYDYVWAAQILLVLPLVLTVLMPTWRLRLWCVAIVGVAAVAWVPWWRSSPDQWLLWHMLIGIHDPGLYPSWSLPPGTRVNPFIVLANRLALFGRCLVSPVAELVIWTQPAVLIHPPVVLAFAALGIVVTAWRRKLFVLASAGLGIAPALLSSQLSISGHRTLLGIAYVSVAAACGVECIRGRRLQIACIIGLVGLATVQSLSLFFSRPFWPANIAEAFPFPP